ncbi:MAG: UvrB/UvrC motif-containing protein [Planctomycetia bacterium]|nr:UvrB/UvrC motif-containing protein [Planctomycetia bacterium]
MSKDITAIVSGWDYEPDELQVRIVAGDDGRDKIQMRVDLGLYQMEISGRPDGARPEGFESLLEFHEARAREAETDEGTGFALDPKDCGGLMREGIQYYHRYLAAFHLQRYDLVACDTERNLRLFAFVVRHAARQRDKIQFDQYRPYVTMMKTRALAHQALTLNDHATALAAIDEGVAAVRQFLRDYQQSENEAECMELGFLLRWRREVEAERPVGPVERLEQQLALAVALEEYEEAARLRDQLQRLRGGELASKPQSA